MSGGKDKSINLWSVTEDKHLAKFTQHRDTVSVSKESEREEDPYVLFLYRALLSVKDKINFILLLMTVPSNYGI